MSLQSVSQDNIYHAALPNVPGVDRPTKENPEPTHRLAFDEEVTGIHCDQISAWKQSERGILEAIESSYEKLKHPLVRTPDATTYKIEAFIANASKNRYNNIFPSDEKRVLLDRENDYINASHVIYEWKGVTCSYIVSQGPLESTALDMHRMLLQYKVPCVVNFSLAEENGKEKVYPYWNMFNADLLIGKGESQYNVVIQGEFNEKDSSENYDHWQIKYCQDGENGLEEVHNTTVIIFKEWPDRDLPDNFALEDFLSYSQTHLLPNKDVVIHCSAGIGRSGVGVVENIYNRILAHQKSEVDGGSRKDYDLPSLEDVVNEIRGARPGLIQNAKQYEFVFLLLANYADQVSPERQILFLTKEDKEWASHQ